MEQVEPKLRGPEQIFWWERIETEHDNIRSALEWSLSGGDTQYGLRLASAVFWFWKPRSYWREGLKWLKDTIAGVPEGQQTPTRARALVVAGNMAMEMYTTDVVDKWYEEALKILRNLGDNWWASYTLLMMGWHRILVNEAISAKSLFEESLAFARQAQEAWILGYALRGLGAVMERFDYAAARPILEESLLYTQATGDRWALADVLKQLGTIAWAQGDFVRLASLSERSLEIFQEMGDMEFRAESFALLARAMLGQGEFKRAAEFCRESLMLAKKVGYDVQIGEAMVMQACIAEAKYQPRRSAILLAAGESFLNSLGTTIALWPWAHEDYDRCMASVQAQLGKTDFGKAVAEGRAMTLERAVKYALDESLDG
jgi:tetratricopeptide (TPR) repeat protein